MIHALTIVHELAHIFINFLGRGQRNTPESMADPSSDTSQASKGEAGAYLEYLMFGGRLLHLRNHAEGDEQVCPYMHLLAGGEAYELTLNLVWRASPCQRREATSPHLTGHGG